MGDLPAAFIGAWRRTELAVGGVPRDDADVLWLQGASWYADVRIPHDDLGGPVEAFAGPAAWSAPHFTWTHELDWLGTFPEDVGHLAWDDGALIETGVFDVEGAEQPYRERWVRVDGGGPRAVATATGADGRGIVAVRVGSHALVVASGEEGFAVRRDRIADGEVESVFHREEGRPPLEPFPFGRAMAPGDRIPYGGELVEIVDVG